MKKNQIIGIFIILVSGILIMADLNYIEGDIFTLFKTYWPLSLVLFAIYATNQDGRTRIPALFLALLGLYLVALRIEYFKILHEISTLSSLILILGLIITLSKEDSQTSIDTVFDSFSLLSTSTLKVSSQDLRGGSIICLLGKNNINLKESFIKSKVKVTVDVFNIFGSCDIKVPIGSNVHMRGFSFGRKPKVEIEDEVEANIKINYFVLFGRVNIKS